MTEPVKQKRRSPPHRPLKTSKLPSKKTAPKKINLWKALKPFKIPAIWAGILFLCLTIWFHQVQQAQQVKVRADALLAEVRESKKTLDIQALRETNDKLQKTVAQLEAVPNLPGISYQPIREDLAALRSHLNTIEPQLLREEQALANLEAARRLAKQAAEAVQNPPHPIAVWEQVQGKWQKAIELLEAVPENTRAFADSRQSLSTYRANYRAIAKRIDVEKKAAKNLAAAEAISAKIDSLYSDIPDNQKSLQELQLHLKQLVSLLKSIPSGTKVSQSAQNLLVDWNEVYKVITIKLIANFQDISLRVHAIKVADSDGQRATNITPQQVNQLVDKTNAIFSTSAAKISLKFNPDPKGPDWSILKNTAINNLSSKNPYSSGFEEARSEADKYPDKIVLFFRSGEDYSSDVREGFSSQSRNFIVLPALQDSSEFTLLAHELGHYLGLSHTFPGRSDEFTDTPEKASEYIADNGGTKEALDGDGIADTPPEAGTSFYFNQGWDTCSQWNDSYTISGLKVSGEAFSYTFTPDRNNVMSYFSCEPMAFTPGQVKRMREWLQMPHRQALIWRE